MNIYDLFEGKAKKQRLDAKCWTGYHKAGTKVKGDTRVNNCVPNEGIEVVREFAPAGGGDSGNYFQALASAWYNGTFDTGSLQKGIKSQQDVERLLNRGIVCPDGKTRKLHIDYNSDFDGVEIYSDDYYEHGDESGELDSRTGQPWGPYDHMEFKDEELDEGVAEGTGQDSKSWMASIRRQHPDVKFIQAKMLGAPIIALVNGKPIAQFDTKKGVAEGTEETPFGSVSHNDIPVKPQQYHYGTEPSDKEIRKQRLLNVRQRKQDLLRDYAQMGALRVELIHGINNDVFLTKDQLLDYFDHLVDDPELTPLEYAHENGIPTDGLLKGMLRRAAQLGVSALDVRKLFASAKAKQGVAEAGYNHGFPDPNAPSLNRRRREDDEGHSEFDDRQRRQTGMIFYTVDDAERAQQLGLKQTARGKWFLRTGNRLAQQVADKEFGVGRIWYPESVEEAGVFGFMAPEQQKPAVKKPKLTLSQIRDLSKQEDEKTARYVRSTDLPDNPDHMRVVHDDVELGELSNELLGRYKKELGVRASAADQAGDFDKGHEYFKKINRATIRQGDNDANADQVGAGKKIDTMKNSLRQRNVDNKKEVTESGASRATAMQVYQYMIRQAPEFMKTAITADVKKAITKAMSYGSQISVPDLATYAYGMLKTNDLDEGELDTSHMNKQHQDFYNKNPNFKRSDREVAVDSTSPIHGTNEDSEDNDGISTKNVGPASQKLIRTARQAVPDARSDLDAVFAYLDDVAKRTQDNYGQVNNILKQLDPMSNDLDKAERELNNVRQVNQGQQQLLGRLKARLDKGSVDAAPAPAQQDKKDADERDAISRQLDQEPKQVVVKQEPQQQKPQRPDADTAKKLSNLSRQIANIDLRTLPDATQKAAKIALAYGNGNTNLPKATLDAAAEIASNTKPFDRSKIDAIKQGLRGTNTQNEDITEDIYESRLYKMKLAGYFD